MKLVSTGTLVGYFQNQVPIFRCIWDRIIYNDEYSTIDSNLTDSNVRARKGCNIRDNIFVLNAVTNSVIKGKEDLQVLDVEKCFDSLWVQECINDIYDAGLVNDKVSLLFLKNQNAKCGDFAELVKKDLESIGIPFKITTRSQYSGTENSTS